MFSREESALVMVLFARQETTLTIAVKSFVLSSESHDEFGVLRILSFVLEYLLSTLRSSVPAWSLTSSA